METKLDVGGNSLKVVDNIPDWKVGDEIAVATSDFEHRHTEYFSIVAKSGRTLTLNATAQYAHLGSADTTGKFWFITIYTILCVSREPLMKSRSITVHKARLGVHSLIY